MAGKIIQTVCGVSGDVQELCAALWDVTKTGQEVTEAEIPAALDVVFMRERKGFEKSISGFVDVKLSILIFHVHTWLTFWDVKCYNLRVHVHKRLVCL